MDYYFDNVFKNKCINKVEHAFIPRIASSNRVDYIKDILKFESPVLFLSQVHSNNVLFIDYPVIEEKEIKKIEEMEADAIITNQSNIMIGVYTADCVPILLYDTENKVIACIHAGYKGLLSGVIENCIERMMKTGSVIHNIIASIGPFIHKENYNVDQNFYNQKIEALPYLKDFFLHKNGQIFFDLIGVVRKILYEMCVKDICEECAYDTYSDIWASRRYRLNVLNDRVKESLPDQNISVIRMFT